MAQNEEASDKDVLNAMEDLMSPEEFQQEHDRLRQERSRRIQAIVQLHHINDFNYNSVVPSDSACGYCETLGCFEPVDWLEQISVSAQAKGLRIRSFVIVRFKNVMGVPTLAAYIELWQKNFRVVRHF